MDTPKEVLQQYFGYSSFRGGQEALIDAQLSGRDAFGIMPTGGGKSICYQIPALMLPGITFVISPLISLMKDQVMALKNAGIPAAFINSSLTPEQIRKVYSNLRVGKYKIVYIAPERLLTDGFLETAQALQISLLAVDEAHCISQWGQDFRPGYLKIADFLSILPARPVVAAFTATATAQVQADVERFLGLRNPLKIVTGFDRPNLYYEVQRPRDRMAALLKLLKDRPDRSGIVYCITRKDTDSVCEILRTNGLSAARYHAGMDEAARQESQEDFVYDRVRIMVATNAFGMGIDKSNVSFVIHFGMPGSLEAYYQEAGRAGRDGERAECILLFSQMDIRTAKFLIRNSTENEEMSLQEREERISKDMIRLSSMVSYCRTTDCLRALILGYFGQSHGTCCGNCGSCLSETEDREITRQAQVLMSCVQRIYNKLGYSMGPGTVIRVLRGNRTRRIEDLHLNELPTYGMLSNMPAEEIRRMIDALTEQGYLAADPVHGGIFLLEQARKVLYNGEKVFMRVPQQSLLDKLKPKPDIATADDALMRKLRSVRLNLARKEHVPLYVIFSNATLADMVSRMPTTREEFLEVSGVGKTKADKYAKPFLKAIRDHLGY